jgi:hypothetical protein
VSFALALLGLSLWVVRPVTAQSPGWPTPIVVSRAVKDASGLRSYPPQKPTLAVSPGGPAHVMWSVVHPDRPRELDSLWYTKTTATGWLTPTLLGGAISGAQPQIAAGADGALHGAWLRFDAYSSTPGYDVHYARGSLTNPYWPPAGPPLFPTPTNSNNLFLTVASEWWDGAVRPHLVWEEPTEHPPRVYYGHVVGSAGYAGPIGPSLDYAGYTPVVTVVGGRTTHVLWSGHEQGASGPRSIYSGYAAINEDGSFGRWSYRITVSTNITAPVAAAARATCTTRNAVSPSVVVAPDGTVHAVWHEQNENCLWEVLTSQMDVYVGVPQWRAPQRVSAVPALGGEGVRPRMAFDRLGQRYVLWNVDYQDVVLARGDASGRWEAPTVMNKGECRGTPDARLGRAVEEVGLAADPVTGTLHAIWLAKDAAGDKVCYTAYTPPEGNRVYFPTVLHTRTITRGR